MNVFRLMREVCILQDLVQVNPEEKAYKELLDAKVDQLDNVKEDLAQ